MKKNLLAIYQSKPQSFFCLYLFFVSYFWIRSLSSYVLGICLLRISYLMLIWLQIGVIIILLVFRILFDSLILLSWLSSCIVPTYIYQSLNLKKNLLSFILTYISYFKRYRDWYLIFRIKKLILLLDVFFAFI